MGTPALPSLTVRPNPSAPEAPTIATGSVGDGATAAEYRLHPVRRRK